MNIFDTRSSTTCHKISSGSYSNELSIKAILLRAPLVHFLLTRLSPGVPNSSCFCNMINYTSKPLIMLETQKYNQRNLYLI